jgi:cytochrome c biogenesis protein CcdA
VSSGALATAFGAGMLATVNPCGFAMLPAYLSSFLGLEQDEQQVDTASAVLRAVRIGAAMTAGFLVVFVLAGVLLEGLSLGFEEALPYLTMLIGVALFVVGVRMLRGWELTIRLPHLERGGRDGSIASMFVFGVSYAVASLSCTIAVFLSVVAGSFTAESWTDGVLRFVAFSLGMGSVVLALTVSLALARHGLVRQLRQSLRYVHRVAGGLLVVTGAYVTYYGWFELRVLRDASAGGGALFDRVNGWNDEVRRWLESVGALRLGGALLLAVAGVVAATLALRRDADERA